ncbi:hypothetical protein BDV59DRAFT_197292 [Aspergillus ambiguus]|uniref:uncharacterized protein n=1 Tax=Aspergillus ambiguus TaxID=176160 RepID=UPI003CCCCDA8
MSAAAPSLLAPPESYRSLRILIIYLSVCAGVAGVLCLRIYRQYKIRRYQLSWRAAYRNKFALILAIAGVDLYATWYHMIAYFVHSYRSWELRHNDAQRVAIATEPFLSRCELWLRDTSLFWESWESVSESAERSWWSGQIFLWTVGWSLFLGVMGRRYNCSHVWAYMLLGQIVAISFAQNLFAATLLVSTPLQQQKQQNPQSWSPPLVLEVAPLVVSLLSAVIVPYVVNTPYFLPVLMVPHVLLFVPGLLSPRILPRGLGSITRETKIYGKVFKYITVVAMIMLVRSTYQASLSTDNIFALPKRLLDVMHEHPAVSSVSWDVVFCYVNAAVWIGLHGGVTNALEV